ncbi:hypothetical protein ACIPRD_05760 [Streptomyces sp. NPDC090108]|uniref:hypothetical protein n=1 Tax=Streptomyces sp. NPDC090108 TaxID=3365947 RepID=UPI003826DCF7
MPTTGDDLITALEPLPFPARLTLTARTARRLADEGRLGALLADLDARGPYERRLAALAALAAGDAGHLAGRLTDPDPVVAGYALRAVRVLPVPDEAVEAAYEDAPAALRRRLAAVIAADGRTALAERLAARLGAEWGDAEAARLLPACSAEYAARELPRLAYAVDGWTRLARRHPGPVLDLLERESAGRAGTLERDAWWRLNATTVAALAAGHPERVMTLLERYGPTVLPLGLRNGLGALVAADAERLVRWIVAPGRERQRYEPPLPPGVLRALVRAAPESLPRLGRYWLNRGAPFAALLKAMPPGRRPAFLDAVLVPGDREQWALHHLGLLPRERRWAEVRRAAASFTGGLNAWDELDTLAHGPFDEARQALLTEIRRPDADDRAAGWPVLVKCAALDGGSGPLTEVLDLTERLRNDQDPVRAAALQALAEVPAHLFAPGHAARLDRLATDALQARDCSHRSLTALRTLAERVLVAHAAAPAAEAVPAAVPGSDVRAAASGDGTGPAARATDATALSDWALRTLERMTGRLGVPRFGPLHRVLRRGQEHQVFEALRPWLEAAAQRSDFRLLLGLAAAFGPRARRMPRLQEMLADALERGDDTAFEAAAGLWLAAPATRDERLARVIALEPSAVVLPVVRRELSRRRTDLLDALLAAAPPAGRFLVPGARAPLPDLADAGRWLPRQQRRAVEIAGHTAADTALPLDDRAAAILAAAPVPELGHALAMRYKDDADVLLAEAALAALSRTEQPQHSLPVLLQEAGGDRARVAVHAAARAARRTAPSRLAPVLEELLTGERPAKVTSRKEAVRLAARFLPARRTVALLSGAFHTPGAHPDVRCAVVRALPPLLGAPEAWDLLRDAARDDSAPVLQALVTASPWGLAEGHRADYAAVVGTAYDACLASYEHHGCHGMLVAVAGWARHDPALADRIAGTAVDLTDRPHWQAAARVLHDLAWSALPHPAGGAAPGSVLHGAVATLLAAVHTPAGGAEALEDRDLPALQRLRILVAPGTGASAQAETLVAQLAAEPLLAAERADLLRLLVERTEEAAGLLGRLRDLAQALDGTGVTVAAKIAERLRPFDWQRGPEPERAEALEAAAGTLARDGGPAAGLLAATLVNSVGAQLKWPAGWRSVLTLLRRHPSPDVRYAALHTLTDHE